jgi:hypothetical protein
MKISETTINILKNFSSINPGLAVKPGQTLRTISKQQNVLAKATITENFSDEIVIFDLNRFLGVVTSLNNPDISISGKKLSIKSDGNETLYGLSDESMIVAPPAKDLKVENAEVNFTLSKENLSQVLKISGVMGLSNIAVIGNGKKITFVTLNAVDNESDTFSVEVGATKAKFKFIFNTENLKMIPGNYTVAISSKGIAYFKNNSDPIEYWIATEAGSSYDGEK